MEKPSLREFFTILEKENKALRIREEVSVRFEIPFIAKELEPCKAVMFEKVKESKIPVVVGVCGSRDRICRALNVVEEQLYNKILEALKNPLKAKVVEDGEVKEVKEKPDLEKFPILTHYDGDKHPYITSAIVSAKNPENEEIENVSIHRLQVLDKNHLAIRIVPRHLYKLCQIAKDKGKNSLDVAISIGNHPAVLLAASSPAPFGISEFEVANRMLNGELKLIECENVNARAPVNSEIIFEARILLDKMVNEGPFVDITGTYDVVRLQPLVEVVNVLRRSNCIYQALIPAGYEHKLLMGLAREAKIWETVKNVVPTVKAVRLTDGGCGWLHVVISLKKQVEGDGKNAILAAFSAHPSVKHVIVVDEDIDVDNPLMVEWALATRFQAVSYTH
ncbi:MAG: UbiD family decarboxylase, partial [Candidatus Bathyarchaeota archaeon]|nr:UbiD family decarboxylase [Candidatus Bathyarchaeota archaeon]